MVATDQINNLLEGDLKGIDEEMLITIGLEVADHQKNASIFLGKIALIQERLPKHSSLREFAKEIGKGEKTMSSYKSVEKRLVGLEIPDDISYTARRLIAQQENPKDILDHVNKEGLSSAEIIKMFGEGKKEKVVNCPRCNYELHL